ncbi:hypothetical protein RFM68_14200 [Mesorhizobium sp. MSK_1335]|uniref:Uncharacterized protein n=1 Tax=Mesorhizobium montanum TaxID=3072323 RepID=A0ABU4ZJW5_9HYPH|nr:hypothetical protein [Mesorhizobium sp. MSK_1335]MDX8525664.1 hypothetical protein [Mesorhizobium sp. MSK_1335]
MANPQYVPGTLVPERLLPLIGLLVVRFGSLDAELNRLIWHVAGLDELAGRAFTASVTNYRPRANLLGWLSRRIESEADRKKVAKLADQFMEIADFRHRVIHDEVGWYSPNTGTVGVWRAEVPLEKRKPTEISEDWLSYYSRLAWEVEARMQQYRIKNSRWDEDTHFPWHETPPSKPNRS